MMKKTYTFIDLFAGIGGFPITAMHYVGGKNAFLPVNGIKNARLSYEANYKQIEPKLFKKDKDGRYLYFNEDINDVVPSHIPDFDVCCMISFASLFLLQDLKEGLRIQEGLFFVF